MPEYSQLRGSPKGDAGAAGYDQEAVKLGPPCTWTGLNLTTDQQALEDFRDSLPEPVNPI